ncbi:MAG: hypothetical protein WC415_01280 [Patescibacteria group bacterium]|jgi:hypothetical protein
MKTRTGFVSNSSSSSFIVGIDKDCKTFEDWCENGLFNWKTELIEGDGTSINLDNIEDKYSECLKTYRECLKRIWDDAHLKKPCELNKVEKYLTSHTKDGTQPDTSMFTYTFVDTFCEPHNHGNNFGDAEREKIIKKMETAGRTWNTLIVQSLVREMADQYDLYMISYSDNDGEFMNQMEHGDHWKMIPCIIISNH